MRPLLIGAFKNHSNGLNRSFSVKLLSKRAIWKEKTLPFTTFFSRYEGPTKIVNNANRGHIMYEDGMLSLKFVIRQNVRNSTLQYGALWSLYFLFLAKRETYTHLLFCTIPHHLLSPPFLFQSGISFAKVCQNQHFLPVFRGFGWFRGKTGSTWQSIFSIWHPEAYEYSNRVWERGFPTLLSRLGSRSMNTSNCTLLLKNFLRAIEVEKLSFF